MNSINAIFLHCPVTCSCSFSHAYQVRHVRAERGVYICRTGVHSRQRTLERRVMASQRAVRTTFESTEQAKAQNRVANLDKYIRDVGNETRKRIDDRLEAVTLQNKLSRVRHNSTGRMTTPGESMFLFAYDASNL